jgi:hypothetical protein
MTQGDMNVEELAPSPAIAGKMVLTLVPRMSWSWIPSLAFAAVAGLAFYFALTGNLSLDCPQHATSCVKIDNWKMSDGHYYRQFPYDSAGNDDPGAAWVEISRPEYVAEVGTRLRQGAPFGVGALCLAWVLAGTFARPRYVLVPPGS